MKHRLFNTALPLLTILVSVIGGGVVCCSGPVQEGDKPQAEFSVTIKTPESARRSGSSWVVVRASGDWILSLDPDVNWARLTVNSGSGNKANVSLSWDENKSGADRSFKLVLESPSDTSLHSFASFLQRGDEASSIKVSKVEPWMELPEVDGKLYFISHPMTLNGRLTRNYSYGWDLDNMVVRWVAYPLTASCMGSSGRSDAWGLDPNLPRSCQPVLYDAYNGFGQRGHQLPSADRTFSLTYNIETFYGTNMTPQNGTLNTGVWSSLEGHVRDCARSFDTLYVVTGCVVEGSPGKSYDNDGKAVTIPSAYYKALLGYKRSMGIGNTSSQKGYTGTAYYFLNQSGYSDYRNQRMTIDELERKTGLDLFPNLVKAIGEDFAATVESTDDRWWK